MTPPIRLTVSISRIDNLMHDHNLFKNYMMQEVLDELDMIECFEQ